MRKFYMLVSCLLLFFTTQSQTQDRNYTINTPGSFQWTVPCDVTQITVEAWGAGGDASNSSAGGGGAYAKKIINVSPGTTYTIQVGSGGATNTSRHSGFYLVSSNILLMAEGALGGTRGTAANSIGDVKFSGGNGVNGTGNGGGGGGSSASSTNNGNSGQNSGGNSGGIGGAMVEPDGGKGGDGGDRRTGWFETGENGQNGSVPGGGGGQAGYGTGLFGGYGRHGSGADGQVRISYQGTAFYCMVDVRNTIEPITNVKFSNLNNITSNTINGTPGYQSFCLTANVVKGQSYNLSVKGNTNGGVWFNYYTDYFTAFIDWNQDGDFDGAGERINVGTITNSSGNDSKTASVNIAVPASAYSGTTKMRIIKNRNDYPSSSCYSPQYGQIEEYIVNVQDQNATITGFTPGSACVGSPVTINGTNFSSATTVKFNGVNAAFIIVSATQIKAIVPSGANTGKISITTPSNTAASSGDFTVLETPTVTNVTGGGLHCGSASLTASGSGTIYFQGTNENGTSTTLGGATVTVNSSGTYYFRSSNGSCWSPAKSVVVTIDQTPAAVTVSGNLTSCGPTLITASGGSGYQIYFQGTNSNGTSVADPANSKTITASGTYYFRAKSSCGWGPEGSITVTVNPIPAVVTVSASPTQFCSSTGTILTASGGSGGTIYFQGTTSGGTSTTQQLSSITVNESGTYYFRSRSAAGCWGAEGSVTVVQQAGFSITSQPQSAAICAGQNVTFNVAVSPTTGVTYQWYKEGIAIVGATSSSYTISNAQVNDASYDYYALITDACGSATTNHVSLTVNNSVTAPTSQPSNLQFVTGATSIGGTFTTTTANGYLVVRTNSPSAPSAPVDGISYTAGQNALGGIIEYSGPDNLFSSTGLAQGTTYYYWIFAYNVSAGGCGNSPDYLNANPLTGNATTVTTNNPPCGSYTTLYWAGEGSTVSGHTNSTDFNDRRNWSLNSTNYQQSPSAPTECTNVIVLLRTEAINLWPFGIVSNNPNLELSNNIKVHSLNLSAETGGTLLWGVWTYNYNSNVTLNTKGKTLEVYGNANIGINFNENSVKIGDLNGANGGVIDFKADVSLGDNNFNDGEVKFVGGSNTKVNFRGSVTFGKLGGIDLNNPIDAIFDGTNISQVTWNNLANTARFRNVIIGQSYSPKVIFAGVHAADNLLGDLTLNNSSTLELLPGQQWNRHSNGGSLRLNQSARLILTGYNSSANGGTATLIEGSNFPSGFTTRTLSSTSRILYNCGTSFTQTIYDGVTYGNLDLSNGNSSGNAMKINTGAIQYSGTLNVNKNTRWDLGANVAGSGVFNVNTDAILMTNTKIVSGSGAFKLNSGGTVGIGSPAGIATSGATGNIQSTNRTFSNDANYIYNGSSHQITGSGLPSIQRSLEINNSANVELSGDAEPVQLLQLTSGDLEIKNHTLTLNSLAYGANKLVGSDVSNITVRGTGVGLNLKQAPGNNTLKELNILNSGTAYISPVAGDTLNITAGLAAGQAGYLKLGSGSALTTNGNLTLKSNNFGTASIAEIPQDANGNPLGTITGDVTVERYINTGTGAGQHGKAWLFLSTPTTGQTIKQSWMENQAPGVVGQPGYGIQLTGAAGQGWDRTSPSPSIKEFDLSDPTGFKGASGSGRLLYNPKGWMVFVRGDRTVNGQSVTAPTPTVLRSKGTILTGKQSFTLSTPTESFTSVGNPYPSAIDMTKILGDQSTFYIWNSSETGIYGYGKYEGYSYVDGHFERVGGQPNEINDLIMSGQAFFIQTDNNTPDMVINEFAKDNSSNNLTYFRGQTGNSPSKTSILRSLIYSKSDLLDGSMHIFNSAYSNNIDGGDGRKMINSGVNLGIYTNKKLLSVERKQPITEADTIFYNMTGVTNGSYKFQFIAKNLAAPGLEAWLEDAFTGTRTPVNLEGTTDVSFDVTGVAASKASNRFRMVFKPEAKGPLPVTFVHVNAAKEGLDVNVKWTVANELNLNQYVVMSSADGNTFTDIATVKANGGSEYSSVDKNAVNGYNYYRIRSEDKDGTKAYSQIVKVWIGNAAPSITVFPNPIVNGVVNLKLENQPAGKYHVRMLNPVGQVVLTKQFDHAGGNYSERIPWDYNMAHGTYQLEVTQPDGGIKIIRIMY